MNGDHKKSIIDLAREFKEMEVRYDLFRQQTDDEIYYWDIFRYNVYMTILSAHGIFENLHGFLNKSKEPFSLRILKAIRVFPLYLVNELRYYFSLKKKVKVAFLLNSRFQDEDGNPTDLLMYDIYDQLKTDAFEFEIFRHKNFSFHRGNIGRRYFLYGLELSYLLGKSKTDDWESLSNLINKEFKLDVDWQRRFDIIINKYRKDYQYFSKKFKSLQPKFLFFQSDPKGMIAAANELGITTIDLQHGHTNNVGVLYSYPKDLNVSHVSTIPKIFLTLGKFWNGLIDFPFTKIAIGNTYFYIEPNKNLYNKSGVMVISVSFIQNYMLPFTAELAKQNPALTFYYKLHSNQRHQESETRAFFNQFSNVHVVYTEMNVKQVMEECFAVVLVQSTVAYQALQRGLHVFILKKDYYEVSYDLLDQKGVSLVNEVKEISAKIQERLDDRAKEDIPIFFEQYDSEVLKSILK